MSPRRTTHTELGSSLIEVILLGLVLMVPLIWTLTVLAEMHRAALASTAVARAIGATVSVAPHSDPVPVVAGTTIRTFEAHGLRADRAEAVVVAPDGLGRGARITVHVSYDVGVLGIPLIGSLDAASIEVSATHSLVVQRYASANR